MKSVVLAVALTGVMSVTTLAGNIPTSDVVAPGHIPTSDVASTGNIPTNDSATSTSSSVTLANVVLTLITLINR